MPLAKIEIEQVDRARWVAEVEVGGLIARRKRIIASGFDDAVAQVIDAYREIMPEDLPARKTEPAPGVDESALRRQRASQAAAKAPLGSRGVAKLRQQADREKEARDPGLAARRADQRHR